MQTKYLIQNSRIPTSHSLIKLKILKITFFMFVRLSKIIGILSGILLYGAVHTKLCISNWSKGISIDT